MEELLYSSFIYRFLATHAHCALLNLLNLLYSSFIYRFVAAHAYCAQLNLLNFRAGGRFKDFRSTPTGFERSS